MVSHKLFRDPIYGYIPINVEYCKNFIDTPIFQRLRRIEQTSMRILYPSAHHDRFAHSLGVFFLGQTAFKSLRNNSEAYLKNVVSPEEWEKYQITFEIACLMHDCGHSPFSHTFEHYYMLGTTKRERIKKELFSFFEGEDIESEYTKKPPAPHETVSALLLLNQYSDQITQMGGDPNLAARMIMGCRHQTGRQTPKKHFENRLISLLNGSAFDVDSLDYIQRDSWASGVSNVEIDYQRLLSALMIKTDNKTGVLQVFFKKSALSVLENVSIGRNFLYKWIYSHHKVQYEQRLLEKIIKEIDTLSNGEFCEKIFSVEALIGDVCFNNLKYYLPTDDDVIHTIKSFKGTVPEIDEYLSREYKYKAIWKTFFEFNEVYFANISDSNKMQIAASLNKGHLNDKYENRIFCIIVEPKMKSIPSNDFFIDIDGQTIDAAKTTSLAGQNLKYFIAYVTPDLLNCKNSIISDLHSLQV